jgi:hypothetical protein
MSNRSGDVLSGGQRLGTECIFAILWIAPPRNLDGQACAKVLNERVESLDTRVVSAQRSSVARFRF